jgi:hypothetical protein
MSWLATATAAVLFAAGLSAQGKPDFSGKWTNTAPAAAPGGGAPGGGAPGGGAPGGGGPPGGGGGGGRGGGRGGGFCGQECTIAQDATTLTVTRTTQAGEQKAVYKLDGSESKNMQQGRGGQTEIVSKAMWDGGKLNISTQQPGRDGGPGATQKVTVSMNAGMMEVETAVEGGGAPAGGAPGGNKQTYKKN